MKCKILHECRGRIRVHFEQPGMTLHQADIAEYYFRSLPFVTGVTVYDRSGDAAITYRGDRAQMIRALARFHYEDQKAQELVPEHTGRELSRTYEQKLVFQVIRRYLKKLLLPAPIRHVITAIHAVKYIFKGLRCLAHGKIEVSVLDATAITVSMLRGDFETAGSVMFLLGIGETLEEWTHKKSVDDLARTMSLNVDKVWLHVTDGSDVLIPVGDAKVSDLLRVGTGSMIPLDGRVVSGEAMVNQSSMTGESEAVRKQENAPVYAGTVIEEGEIIFCVEKAVGEGRYDRIVHMIEESEKLKSDTEARAEHLADRLVPWSLGGTALAWLFTRNATRALSFLMVDFSCALKLAMPISVLSAMKECSAMEISVKGGKFLEAVATADTIVFDKTGTLTEACPRVVDVVPFGHVDRREALQIAACLEEHYPHSIANAIVREAKEKGILHDEMHAGVTYVVAHGVRSTIGGKEALIGSYHFVFEDNACIIPEGELQKFDNLPPEYSHLYLAVDGVLYAVICIEDTLKTDAAQTIQRLHELGFRNVVMMTGDSERTAAAVAKAVGVDSYYSEVLPEDKARFIREERKKGHKVVMVGDGVNDSPALSEADAGIAIASGAAIAREIADIVISSGGLQSLILLKQESNALMARINSNYRFIMGFNGGLIALGLGGILPPATSALLHNASTLCIALKSMTRLLPSEQQNN